MTMSFLRKLAVAPLVLAFGGLLAGCGGATTGTEPGGVKPGDPPNDGGTVMCAAGEHRNDGCNTCSCVGGQWACTEKACPQPVCKDGEQRSQGCATCTCTNGAWQCPLIGCPEPVCSDGSTRNDGCNTCTCAGGQWGCTQKACPPPDPVCKEGVSMYDGCNTCTCAGGQWGCTARYCPPPATDGGAGGRGCGGWLGDTCSAVEYCAYMPGQYCGGADASSTCQPRPSACDDNYDPVCGCNGKTYPNTCSAAASGTGVMSKGPCATQRAF